MEKIHIRYSSGAVDHYFGPAFDRLLSLCDWENLFIITDKNISRLYRKQLERYRVIEIEPGEMFKNQQTADKVILSLIELGADRQSFIIGLGGGVVTDLTGYVASIYKRGVKFGFVPTSLLAMVDAAMGGKNGVDVGLYKNMVGTFRHPDWIIIDPFFLHTLPDEEWSNGFAEIIKHAVIHDEFHFAELESFELTEFKKQKDLINSMIHRSVSIKTGITSNDEFEKGERKLLNFGHTIGHAIENKYNLSHGHAISIGMVAEALLSTRMAGLSQQDFERLEQLLEKFNLPVNFNFDVDDIWKLLLADKKIEGDEISIVLLKSIGEPMIRNVPLRELRTSLQQLNANK